MNEQQTAYEQALAIDREKAQQRKLAEQKQKDAEKKAKEEAERVKNKKDRLEAMRKRVAENMKRETDQQEMDSVRIRISFPNGGKVERRFRRLDSLEVFFDFNFERKCIRKLVIFPLFSVFSSLCSSIRTVLMTSHC